MFMDKKCCKCHKDKSVDSFYRKWDNRVNKYVVSSWCKTCQNEAVRRWQNKNKDKVRQYDKARDNTIDGRYRRYKHEAKRRNIDFNITKNQFKTYWKKKCYFCGGEIKTIGLDRIDNNKGYSIDNLKSCCKVCNRMKGKMSYPNFINHCKKIVSGS